MYSFFIFIFEDFLPFKESREALNLQIECNHRFVNTTSANFRMFDYDNEDRKRVLNYLISCIKEYIGEEIKNNIHKRLDELRDEILKLVVEAEEALYLRESYCQILTMVAKYCELYRRMTRASIIKKNYKTKGGRHGSTYIYKALNELRMMGLIKRDFRKGYHVELTKKGLMAVMLILLRDEFAESRNLMETLKDILETTKDYFEKAIRDYIEKAEDVFYARGCKN